jgi:hypothetical protein
MSVLPNPVQSQSFIGQACLNRSLLFCRFDFRQKTWGLPPLEIYLDRDRDAVFPNDSTVPPSAISKMPSDFSDPSLGGAKPPKTATRRIGIRHSHHRSLGKPNNQQKKEK